MPSANGNLSNNLPKTREYEVIVVPQSPTSPQFPNSSPPQQPVLVTKRISCNQRNGCYFWIPEGYRPVLVRTEDLPLLVGTEYNSPPPSNSSGYSSGDESSY